ncbi:ArsR/SmtB family transcription factor [Oligosphaera ethanolica]|uniref:ArsR family transcriptional regulator n=1 Tax=Oligosphaera ethanolica TaxID=760260 RepID=A0AAE3VK52_9BACT|nr:metalloregulator ArsR/SmtB family transcription factor [Oligosphaera ethanolica]MDQ0291811.1 ArsR family transcriptional regulator [Oligosphaera ethanolica]
MLKFEKKTCQEEAEVFKALGHPTRLWIVKQLADGQEHCVCEFVDAIGVQFATISQHLTILRQAGIVESDKRGQSVFYRLRCPCILDVVTCMQNRK